MKKKIGFFGGSFDPIHFGHLNLALEMLEKHQLDQILFCPAKISPNKVSPNKINANKKNEKPISSIDQRMKMVEIAIQDIPAFKVIDIEAKREGISYTVDTLKQLKEELEADLYLILGFDTANNFFEWKNPEEILSLAKPLIGIREESTARFPSEFETVFKKGLTKTRRLDISSREIRERIFQHHYIGHLVPAKVVDYIYQNLLYLNSF